MFNKIKKEILIEYLIREIDCLEPLEKVYKTYITSLLDISNIKYLNEKNLSFREEFILLLDIVDKEDILSFCIDEFFTVDIELVELVLGRKLVLKDYDLDI